MAVVEREHGPIHYARSGSGPAVLLVQGVGVIGAGWRPQVEALRERYSVVTIDNRGIGGSSAHTGEMTVEAMADDVLAVADGEGIERFHLAGHSLGGLIAQQVAFTARERVKSLALLCTFRKGRQGTTVAPAMLPAAIRSRVGTRRMRRRAFVELIMPAAYLAGCDRDRLCEELGSLFGRDLGEQPAIVGRQLLAMGRFDGSARLRELAGLPTLVISGTHDCIARPAYGRELAAAIPGARYVEFDDAGHALPIQCAARVNSLLLDLFGSEEKR